MLPLAFALAAVSALWMLVHVARRYRSAPKRVPWRVEMDGRPSKRLVGKWFLWVGPAIVTSVILVVGTATWLANGSGDDFSRTVLALVFLVCAEVAWFVAWVTDRQIELARKMTYRIAPARTWRAALPILLTTAVTLIVAARF